MTILGALSHRTAAEWVPAWNLRVRGARLPGRLWGMEGPCANAALGLVDARARLSSACERCQRLSPSKDISDSSSD